MNLSTVLFTLHILLCITRSQAEICITLASKSRDLWYSSWMGLMFFCCGQWGFPLRPMWNSIFLAWRYRGNPASVFGSQWLILRLICLTPYFNICQLNRKFLESYIYFPHEKEEDLLMPVLNACHDLFDNSIRFFELQRDRKFPLHSAAEFRAVVFCVNVRTDLTTGDFRGWRS